nr:DNA-binding protein [Vibrio sp. 10N.286.48.B7]PMH78499.1 hypothetical protein BCU58_08985 [Vibrio sp. 10N.286.48.B7]
MTEVKIGRRAEVEDSRIIEAAMSILEQNKNVSGWKLRNIIGAGDPKRLMKVWETHLEETGGDLQIAEQPEENSLLPPDVEESLKVALGTLNSHIEELVTQANNAAVRAADKRVATEYNASKHAREEAEQELAEAEVALSHADDKVDELQAKVLELEELYRNASGELQSSNATNKSLDKQLKAVTKERDDFEQRCKELVEEDTQNKIAISTANNKCEQLSTGLDNLKEEKSQIAQELSITQNNLSKNTGILESAQTEIENKTKQIEDINQKMSELQGQLSKQTEEIGSLKGRNELLNETMDSMNTDHQVFSNLLQNENDSLTQQLEEYVAKFGLLDVEDKHSK